MIYTPGLQDAPAGGAVAGVLRTIAPGLMFICRISPGFCARSGVSYGRSTAGCAAWPLSLSQRNLWVGVVACDGNSICIGYV